jgi:ribosomal protein L18E
LRKDIHREVLRHLEIVFDDQIRVLEEDYRRYAKFKRSLVKHEIAGRLYQAKLNRKTIDNLYRGVQKMK